MHRFGPRLRRGSQPLESLAPGLIIALSALAIALAKRVIYRTLAAGRTLEPCADLGQIQPQLGHSAAEGIAMHTELFCRLALISPMRHQDLAQILPLELAHGIVIADAAGVHLRHKAVQFSSHASLLKGVQLV